MEIERKQDLSIVFWLKNEVFQDLPTVNIVDGYNLDSLVLPTVAVESENIRPHPRELGNRRGIRQRLWSIDVFGSTKTQRDTMAYRIIDAVELYIPVYDYDEGFDTNQLPTRVGTLKPIPDSITATPIRIFPELVSKLYWRYRIRFITEYDVI